ncbi:MAG: bile acid:sodium symporter family protein [Aeromicrobium sp.]|nr:MAG: bile acid:sodium symporter family protein [Aeromicrobium sp.]
MDSALTTVGLPIALGIVMFGLGLSLTVDDFRNVTKNPKAVAIALGCQLILLPALCFGLVVLFDLKPALAVGMMLLAASPGGTTANLFSHLFRGDVALNVSLTAVNSVIAIFTLPLITNLAIFHFYTDPENQVSLQFTKVVEVFAIVLVPVALGMVVKSLKPLFADKMDKPVRILSAVVLAAMVIGILLGELENVGEYLKSVGPITMLFCALSLALGYFVPRALGLTDGQAVASSFEIGVHNSTLAMYVAVKILESEATAVPAAVYSLVMFLFAALWGLLLTKVILPRRSSDAVAR